MACLFLRKGNFELILACTKGKFSISMDIVLITLMVYSVARLCAIVRCEWLKFPLIQLGKYSMLMWFVSCIFFGNSKQLVQPLLYYPHHPVLVTVWGLLMCYVAAVILDVVIKKLRTWGNMVHNKAL